MVGRSTMGDRLSRPTFRCRILSTGLDERYTITVSAFTHLKVVADDMTQVQKFMLSGTVARSSLNQTFNALEPNKRGVIHYFLRALGTFQRKSISQVRTHEALVKSSKFDRIFEPRAHGISMEGGNSVGM